MGARDQRSAAGAARRAPTRCSTSRSSRLDFMNDAAGGKAALERYLQDAPIESRQASGSRRETKGAREMRSRPAAPAWGLCARDFGRSCVRSCRYPSCSRSPRGKADKPTRAAPRPTGRRSAGAKAGRQEARQGEELRLQRPRAQRPACARRSCSTSSSARTRSSSAPASRSARSSRTWCARGGRGAVTRRAAHGADLARRGHGRRRARQAAARSRSAPTARTTFVVPDLGLPPELRDRPPRQPRLPAHARRADARHDLRRRRGEGRRRVRRARRRRRQRVPRHADQRPRLGRHRSRRDRRDYKLFFQFVPVDERRCRSSPRRC